MARKGQYVRTLTVNGKRKYIYGKTKEECEQKYLQAKLEANAGVDICNDITFGEFCAMWWNSCKAGKLKPQTERRQKGMVNNHILPVLSHYELRKVTPMMCNRVFAEMDKKGICKAVQKSGWNLMHQMFECAVDNNIILRNPVNGSVKIGGRDSKKVEALSDSQVDQLLTGIKKYGLTPEAFVIVALGTGLRRGEILALKWEDVDMDRSELHVHATATWPDSMDMVYQETTKTAAGNRVVPFGPRVRTALQRLRLQSIGSEFVFTRNGHPYRHGDANYLSIQIRNAAPEVSATPHQLRHTCITKWAAYLTPAELKAMAGHSTIAMSYDVYTSYGTDQHEQTRDKILNHA